MFHYLAIDYFPALVLNLNLLESCRTTPSCFSNDREKAKVGENLDFSFFLKLKSSVTYFLTLQ